MKPTIVNVRDIAIRDGVHTVGNPDGTDAFDPDSARDHWPNFYFIGGPKAQARERATAEARARGLAVFNPLGQKIADYSDGSTTTEGKQNESA